MQPAGKKGSSLFIKVARRGQRGPDSARFFGKKETLYYFHLVKEFGGHYGGGSRGEDNRCLATGKGGWGFGVGEN